jgi:hypothetical protein
MVLCVFLIFFGDKDGDLSLPILNFHKGSQSNFRRKDLL